MKVNRVDSRMNPMEMAKVQMPGMTAARQKVRPLMQKQIPPNRWVFFDQPNLAVPKM